MIDYLFYLCVDILVWLAELTGTTYELINIIIFVIGYPLFVILLLFIIYFQYKKIKKMENKFDL
jgi:Mn2+/Fe2+ NRAMP family transporter|tara:strand:+ start:322 stop:513 length:192 start_codon:yes stop_codon:yes gene_type:complete